MATINLESEEGRLEVLERMLTIREFDGMAGDLFADGEIPGFVHLYIGEEAVAVGACAALDEEDYITSTHRGHGHCIAKGLDPDYMMAELLGSTEDTATARADRCISPTSTPACSARTESSEPGRRSRRGQR